MTEIQIQGLLEIVCDGVIYCGVESIEDKLRNQVMKTNSLNCQILKVKKLLQTSELIQICLKHRQKR